MVNFGNRSDIRDKGKERTNGETRVASGKRGSNEMNGKEGHLMSLTVQMLTRHLRISTGMLVRGQGLSGEFRSVGNTEA